METKFVLGVAVVALSSISCDAGLSDAADPRAASPGLVATATDGQSRVVFVTATPNFNLKPHQSIHPQLRPSFKAEWNGFLTIVRGGKYKIDRRHHRFVGGRI